MLASSEGFNRLEDTPYRKNWVVYAKRPFAGPEQVFKYPGRYTHRVGISNQRLVSFDEHSVCFRTKNGKQVIGRRPSITRRTSVSAVNRFPSTSAPLRISVRREPP